MSTSPVLSFSGAGSGIDTASMVTALMNIERQPVTKIQSSIKTLNTEKSVVQEINTQLSTLRSKAVALFSDPTALSAKKAVSGDDKLLTATAGSTAASGTYNVNVTALAQTHTVASNASPVLTSGTTLDFTVGGTTKSVAVEAGDTLQSFADRVNQAADVGVSASVVNDRLVFISQKSGTAGAITLGGSAAGALGATTTQAAQDAAATINGISVTSSGNTITGSISGLDITLKGLGSTTIEVSSDDAAVTKKVQDFVDAYNAVQGNMARVTLYDPATKTAGALQGDAMMRGIQSQLRSALGNTVQGVSGAYDSMFSIGIDSSRSGQLTLDATKLSEALKADPQAVAKVFGATDGATTSSLADGIGRRIDDLVRDYSTGPIAERISGYGNRVMDLNQKIDRMNANLAVREQRLKSQFQAMDVAIAKLRSSQADFMARLGQG